MSTDTGAGVAPSDDAPQVSPRRERTRERLLDAAFEVFSRVGVQGSSIETICDAAGFTRGAFYSNFASKEELLVALVTRDMRARLASLEGVVEELDVTAVEGSTVRPEVVRTVFAAVMGDPDDQRRFHLVQTEFELMALRDPEIGQRYQAQQEQIRGELLEAMRRVFATLGLRFVIPDREAVDILVATYLFSAQQAFFVRGEDPRATALLEPVVRLLATEA
ncbi:TetR/AcrR family transcriptional regulator [Georgenia alba]|uniref:TetR/AcrR family transcriptional regulator n=1 Tax=Georgenia alba TaxID=2233858 RepID=A0ABW2Q8K2_9MICO